MQIPSQLFDLRAVCRGNNELFLVPWNKTLKYLNYFLLGFYSKVKYNNICTITDTSQSIIRFNRISSAIANVVGSGFDSPDRVKPNIMKLLCAASPLSTQNEYELCDSESG